MARGRPKHSPIMQRWKEKNPLRLWRKNNQFTHTQAAAELGISVQTWYAYEWGLSLPKTDIIRVWSHTLKTYVTHKWDSYIGSRTNVMYADMVRWHKNKPIEGDNGTN